MSFRVFSFSILVFFPAMAFSQETLVLRSENLKELVEKRSERIKAKEFEAEAASLRTGSFARSFLPTVEVYVAEESFRKGQGSQKTQPTYGAEAKINLFNAGF
jgi:hypothetical protein